MRSGRGKAAYTRPLTGAAGIEKLAGLEQRMICRNRCAALAALTVLLTSLASHAQNMEAVPEEKLESLNSKPACVPAATAGYPKRECVVSIERSSPVSPPPLLVPPGTKVFVKVTGTRPNEIVLFSLATTHTTPPDVAGAAIKSIITPLQSFVFTQGNYHLEGTTTPDDIDINQEAIAKTLDQRQSELRHATAALTCLSNYQVRKPDFMCSQADLLDAKSFTRQEQEAEQTIEAAAKFWSPVGELKDLDSRIQNRMTKCLVDAEAIKDKTEKSTKRSGCLIDANRHMSNQAVLNAAVSDMQKAQATLLISLRSLKEWLASRKDKKDIVAYQFTSSKLIIWW